MESDRFRRLVDATGPFVSVYFDDSHDTADATAQLDARLRDVRKHLEEQSVDTSVIDAIETAVRAKHPPVGRSGRGVIAAGSEIVLDERLIRPPTATILRVLHTSYLMVAVDNTGADISLASGSQTVKSDDHAGPQGKDEAVRKNIREVADRVTHLVDEHGPDIVFITGETTARAELLAELPERVTAKAVQLQGGGRTAGTDDTEVHHEMGQEFLKRRLAAIDDAAQRFNAGRGTGLAVEGLANVMAALRDGAVDTLIIGDLGQATIAADHDQLLLSGPDATTVSALGGSPDRVLRADEALPLIAVATHAALIRTDERLDPADGVGALLRYADPNAG